MPAFNAWMQQRFPDMHLPKIVMFYLHDADVRLRDTEYRRVQDDAVDALIAELEQGEFPDAPSHSGCAFPLTWLAVAAVIALMALMALFDR